MIAAVKHIVSTRAPASESSLNVKSNQHSIKWRTENFRRKKKDENFCFLMIFISTLIFLMEVKSFCAYFGLFLRIEKFGF